MPTPKRKSPVSGWRSPLQGWEYQHPGRYLHLCADFKVPARDVATSIAPLLRSLGSVLGEHPVKLTTCAVQGKAWRTDLPWRSVQYATALTLPISKLANSGVWRQVIDCIDGGPSNLEAVRGGGSTRHIVWHLEFEEHPGNSSRLELYIAEHHLNDRQTAQTEKLIAQFFKCTTKVAPLLTGYGQVRHLEWPCRFIGLWGSMPNDQWVFEALQEMSREIGDSRIPWPRWITALTAEQVKALGGMGALAKRYSTFVNNLYPVHDVAAPRRIARSVVILPLGGAGLVLLSDVLRGLHCNRYGEHVSDTEPLHWFLDELRRADLLSIADPNGLKRSIDATNVGIARYEAGAGAADAEPAPPAIPLQKLLQHVREHPPSCLTASAQPGDDVPSFLRLDGNAAAFRIRSHGLADALPIYGRKPEFDAEPNTLQDPILVGSHKQPRAGLFFDARIHGWDGAQSDPVPARARPIGRLTQLSCPECGGRLFHAWASFEYPDDIPESTNLSSGQCPEDFFSWFWLAATCASCKWSGLVADIECA